MGNDMDRRRLSFKEILALISLILVFTGTVSGVVYKFSQHDSAIRVNSATTEANKAAVKALDNQKIVLAELTLLVDAIYLAIDKFDSSQRSTQKQIIDLTIGQNQIKTELKLMSRSFSISSND